MEMKEILISFFKNFRKNKEIKEGKGRKYDV